MNEKPSRDPDAKWCLGCDAWHPFVCFDRDTRALDGLKGSCREAVRKRVRQKALERNQREIATRIATEQMSNVR